MHLDVVDPSDPRAAFALRSYFREIAPAFGPTFDPDKPRPVDGYRAPHGVFLLVSDDDGTTRGCGAVTWIDDATAELKRVWVDPAVRGQGVARTLVGALEQHAREHGSTVIRLSTHRELAGARAMYPSLGYAEVDRFTQEQFAHHWFAKVL